MPRCVLSILLGISNSLISRAPVIHIGTFIATLAVARKAAHVRGRGVLLLLAVALWVLAFVNEAATLGFYQTAATHGDQTTEAAYRYLADNQAGPWNVAVLVSGFLATVLADGYLVRVQPRLADGALRRCLTHECASSSYVATNGGPTST